MYFDMSFSSVLVSSAVLTTVNASFYRACAATHALINIQK